MSSALFAALAVVAFATTGAYGKCPESIEAVTTTVTQGRIRYDWTFSPTGLSTVTPKGASPCGPAYIAKFGRHDGSCHVNCDRQPDTPVRAIDGCVYSFLDASSNKFFLQLKCEARASTLTLDPEVRVTESQGLSTYVFTGWHAGVCEYTTVVPTAATPEDCTAKIATLVSICVAVSIAGIVMSAITLVILMRKIGRPQCDASVTSFALNTDGHVNSPLIVKQC